MTPISVNDQVIRFCFENDEQGPIKLVSPAYVPIPKIRNITQAEVEDNYRQIKDEVAEIIDAEMERIYHTPELAHLLVAREE